MRTKGSITGPLVIIAIGALFLVHSLSPELPVVDWFGHYWPYVLIIWGLVALLEVVVRYARGAPLPVNGVSGGGWFAVIVICVAGLAMFQMRNPQAWWRHTDWGRGIDSALGEEHNYSIENIERNTGTAPHIVIEELRGDIKIAGGDGSTVTVGGHKSVRAFKDDIADRTNTQTPVEVVIEGNNVIVRANQNRALYRTSVTTNLDLTVPRGSSVDVNGTFGDLDVSAVSGDVRLRSGNAGMRLQDLGGNVSVDTRRSDLVRCTNVTGNLELRGHGSDLELSKIEGQVTVSGEYNGTISLHELSKPVSVQSMRTDLRVERIPGEVRLDRGSLNMQNVIGPVQVTAHSTDVTLEDFSNALDVSVDRGDIDLKPGRIPLARMNVHAGSGNIELSLPQTANFALSAITGHGQVENEYGDTLKEQSSGHGARLEGSVGNGPDVNLTTGRGSITLRKSGEVPQTTAASVVK